MSPQIFLPLLRELAASYQTFTTYGAAHIRQMDLTPSQFDILATLGNTAGMPFKELGEKTLITKGTLTGVVERLVAKGLVQRTASATDGRSQIVQLTAQGDALFQQHFPAHLDYVGQALQALSETEMQTLTTGLRNLRNAFSHATEVK